MNKIESYDTNAALVYLRAIEGMCLTARQAASLMFSKDPKVEPPLAPAYAAASQPISESGRGLRRPKAAGGDVAAVGGEDHCRHHKGRR